MLDHVLIVDDEPAHLEGLTRFVHWQECGYASPIACKNAQEGLHILKQQRIDVVLADIRMPGESGLDMICDMQNLAVIQPQIIIISGYDDFSYAQRAILLGVRAYLLKPIKTEEVEMWLQNLHEECRLEKPSPMALAQRYAEQAGASAVHSVVNRAMTYIDAHLSERIHIGKLCESWNINPSYFSALFKKETGENLSDYLTRRRMDRAMELLTCTDRKIYQIAQQVGYPTQAYFSEQFKKHFNCSPRDMRDAARHVADSK